jgi:hypothetical protein
LLTDTTLQSGRELGAGSTLQAMTEGKERLLTAPVQTKVFGLFFSYGAVTGEVYADIGSLR